MVFLRFQEKRSFKEEKVDEETDKMYTKGQQTLVVFNNLFKYIIEGIEGVGPKITSP